MEVKTVTFTRLLDNARQWDSRYKELRNAQTCWMLRHFSFGDSFCEFIDLPDNELRRQRELDRRRWDRLDAVLKSLANIGRVAISILPGEEGIKKCLLSIALLFALLSPATVKAQDFWDYTLNANAGLQLYPGTGWQFLWISNEDWRPEATIQIVLLNLPTIECWRVYVAGEEPNWWHAVETEQNGTCTITWIADGSMWADANSIWIGTGKPLWFFIDGGPSNLARGGFCASGPVVARCSGVDVPSF